MSGLNGYRLRSQAGGQRAPNTGEKDHFQALTAKLLMLRRDGRHALCSGPSGQCRPRNVVGGVLAKLTSTELVMEFFPS